MTTANEETESSEKHPPKKVEVTVDGKQHHVRAGAWTVADFKREVKVDAARELDQVIDGQLVPLDNNASITIKGGEKFISHVPQGGSS